MTVDLAPYLDAVPQKIVDRLRQAMFEVGGNQLQSLMPMLREMSSRVATARV